LTRVKQQGATAMVIGDLAQLPNIEAGDTTGLLDGWPSTRGGSSNSPRSSASATTSLG
jgi:hypothetical protein